MSGLVLRLLLGGFTNTPSVDAAAFQLPLAEALVHGDVSDWRWATHPPVFPWVVAAVRVLLGVHVVSAGQLVSGVAGSLTVLVGAFLARRLLGGPALVPAAWLLAFLPLSCHYSARGQTEALYALFFAWALLELVRLIQARPDDRGLPAALRLGMAAGLAWQTRHEGLGLLVAGLLACALAPALARPAGRLRAAALVVIPFLVISVPGVLLARHVTGRWTVSSKAGYIFQRNLQEDPNAYYFRLTEDGRRLLFEEYVRDPERAQRVELSGRPFGTVLRVYAGSLLRFVIHLPRTYDVPFLVLALVGLAARPRTRPPPEAIALALLLGAYVVALPIFSSERRFWVALFPILVPLTVRGVGAIAGRLATAHRSAARLSTLIVLLVVAATLPHTLAPVREHGVRWQDCPEKRLARLVPPGRPTVVLSDDGRVALFAGASHLFLPEASLDEILAFARHRGARYLAIEQETTRKRRPGLLEELANRGRTGGPISPGWTVVVGRAEQGSGRKARTVWLFEIRR